MRNDSSNSKNAYDELEQLLGNSVNEKNASDFLLRHGHFIGPFFLRKKVVKTLCKDSSVKDLMDRLASIAQFDVKLAVELVRTDKNYEKYLPKIIEACQRVEGFGEALLKHNSFKQFCRQYFLQDIELGADHWQNMLGEEKGQVRGRSCLSQLLISDDKQFYALDNLLEFFNRQRLPVQHHCHELNDTVLWNIFNRLIPKSAQHDGRLSLFVLNYLPSAVIGRFSLLSKYDYGNKDLTRLYFARINVAQLTTPFVFDEILKTLDNCLPYDNFKRCAAGAIYQKVLKTPLLGRAQARKLSVEQLVRLAVIYKGDSTIIKAMLKKPLFRKPISDRFKVTDWLRLINNEVDGVQNYVCKHSVLQEMIRVKVLQYLDNCKKGLSTESDLRNVLEYAYKNRKFSAPPWVFIKDVLLKQNTSAIAELEQYLGVPDLGVPDEGHNNSEMLSVSRVQEQGAGDESFDLQSNGSYASGRYVESDVESEGGFELNDLDGGGYGHDFDNDYDGEISVTSTSAEAQWPRNHDHDGGKVLILNGQLNQHSLHAHNSRNQDTGGSNHLSKRLDLASSEC